MRNVNHVCKTILLVILYRLLKTLSFYIHFIMLSTSKLLRVFDFCTTTEYNIRGLILMLIFLDLLETYIAEQLKKDKYYCNPQIIGHLRAYNS